MHSSSVFVALALVAPILAAPAPVAQLEAGVSAVVSLDLIHQAKTYVNVAMMVKTHAD